MRTGHRGWLRAANGGRYWCDLCQIGDAMFAPFIDAVSSRLPHARADIEACTRVRGGQSLNGCWPDLPREDTGLRVLGQRVWRIATIGKAVYVCEVLPGESVLLVYEPAAKLRKERA